MPEKIGVYIDESSVKPLLNAEELAEFVRSTIGGKCPVVRTHSLLNTQEGHDMIQADLDAGEIDAVCICGTSPRVDWNIFDFGPKVLVERVNLREQCVMCFQNPDGSVPQAGGETPLLLQDMARDYIKMGVTRLGKSAISSPEAVETVKTILVMGGGFTGLNAAKYAAQSGHEVILVEKAEALGGKAATMLRSFPMSYPWNADQDTGIKELIADVTGNGKITVFTGSELESLAGAPGSYTATIGGQEYKVGAVVMATGWVPGKADYLAPLGYGKMKNVVTTDELEAMAKNGGIKRPSDGKAPGSVAFILDVSKCIEGEDFTAPVFKDVEEACEAEEGEEETFKYENKESAKHLKYSSELTSLVALKQAGYVRESNPDTAAYLFYDHMTVPGINEKYYKTAQDDPGIMLSKAKVVEVKEGSGGSMSILAKDTLLGEDIEVVADMVVLPTSMVPVTAHKPTINLVYRQGPHFPDLELFDGYADSNYICFPYETRRTGVYAAGCAHQPMSMAMAKEDAAGAVLKAVQCINSANHGVAVHPRSGDNTYPVFNFVRCTQCKRCTEECPFGALDDDEKGTPLPNPTRCRRCGTCMGACPERVISFDNYNVDQIGSAIKEVRVPDDMAAEGPRIIVLACENDAYPAIDMAAMRGKRWSPYVRFVPVRCLGSVNAIWVADAMGKGVDGFLMLGCKYGEDYQCHFVKGSELCNRRAENIADTLKRLGVEPERVEQKEVAIDEYDKVPEIIDEFVDYILQIGPNPFKGY